MPEKNTSARETQNGTEKLDQSGPSATKVYPDLVPMPARDAPAESRLGERIKYARDNLGLSVEALSRLTKNFDQSDQVGIPASTLMRYEKGDTYPTARELRLLCDALYLPPRWVLYGELENSGRNAEEQSLLLALDSYVRATSELISSEHRDAPRWMFDHNNHPNRVRMIEEAKKPTKSA